MEKTYTVLIYQDEDPKEGYWAKVAELPGCYTSGYTVEEILENIRDAIDAYFEGIEATGAEMPPTVTQKVEITVTV